MKEDLTGLPPRGASRAGSTGKVDRWLLARLLREVRARAPLPMDQPPGVGVDVGGVRIRGGILLATVDPLYVMPEVEWGEATWFSFHSLAGDMATSGVPPQFLLLDLNLPPGTQANTIRAIVRGFRRAAHASRTTLLGGHTGRYAHCSFPMVGSGTVLSVAPPGGFVTTRMARPGHRILGVGPVGLEAAWLLAIHQEDAVERCLGVGGYRHLRQRTRELTVLPTALEAAKVGLGPSGVSAMHDASEGGVLGAVWDIAEASHTDVELDRTSPPVEPDVGRVLDTFHLNPLTASSQGVLLVCVHPSRVPSLARRMSRLGRKTFSVGSVGQRSTGKPRVRRGGVLVGPPGPDEIGRWISSEGSSGAALR